MRTILALTFLAVASSGFAGQIVYSGQRAADPPPPPPGTVRDLDSARRLAEQMQRRLQPAHRPSGWVRADARR